MDLFNEFPVMAYIDDKILLVHGGLYQELNTLDQLFKIKRPTELIKLDYYGVILNQSKKLERK